MTLDGKTAVVTGGAKGIGKAIARRFLSEGAGVVIVDSDEEAGAAAVADLKGLGAILFVPADISEALDVHNVIAETLDGHDGIDILVNNAAVMHASPFLDLEETDFDRVIRINLKGAFVCAQAIARAMVRRIEEGGPAGTIVNISSIHDRLALADHLAYSVSKGGLLQLTRTMAVALAKYGIRVNAVAPGAVETGMLEADAADRKTRSKHLERTPLGRLGEAGEIAAIAAFLVSDDASYMTGQTLYADGGRLLLDQGIDQQQE